MPMNYPELKIALLTSGINYDDTFLKEYGGRSDLIQKRRAYSNSDEVIRDPSQRVPPELLFGDGTICAINYAISSPWSLKFVDEVVHLCGADTSMPVAIPSEPLCYAQTLSNGEPLNRVATVYGNTTLGIFSPGHCYYFNDNRECRFCSLGPTRDRLADHRMKVLPQLAREATSITLQTDPGRIRHVLLNGGSIPNYDKGFLNHTKILEEIVTLDLPDEIETHAISMPPKDFGNFERMAKTGATLAMSLEIYNPHLFEKICPGKAQDYGRERFLASFEAAVEAFGRGRVYAGFVAGLEPADSLIEGMHRLSEKGVVPAVAVFHRDAGSQLHDHPRPSFDFIRKIGEAMSEIYVVNGFRAFITGSGRNSLDTEAAAGAYSVGSPSAGGSSPRLAVA